MKTMESRKSRKNLKLILAGLAMGLTIAASQPALIAHAELVDETEEWNREGEQHNEQITEQEQQEHTQQNIENQNNGGSTPAEQSAEAVVDNSQGGTEPTDVPVPETAGQGFDAENYEPKPEDTKVDPSKNKEDEAGRKTKDEQPGPGPEPEPSPEPEPEKTTTTTTTTVTTVTVPVEVQESKSNKTGNTTDGVVVAIAALGTAYAVIDGRKYFLNRQSTNRK